MSSVSIACMKLWRHSWLSEASMKDHCCTQWNLIFGFNRRSQSMFCKQCISRIAGVNISATYNFTAKRCQTGQETTYCLSNKIKTEWILVSFNKKCTPWYNVGRVWQWHLFKDEGFSTEQINIPKNMLTALHVPWLSLAHKNRHLLKVFFFSNTQESCGSIAR